MVRRPCGVCNVTVRRSNGSHIGKAKYVGQDDNGVALWRLEEVYGIKPPEERWIVVGGEFRPERG
jgi:hypothetical protein